MIKDNKILVIQLRTIKIGKYRLQIQYYNQHLWIRIKQCQYDSILILQDQICSSNLETCLQEEPSIKFPKKTHLRMKILKYFVCQYRQSNFPQQWKPFFNNLQQFYKYLADKQPIRIIKAENGYEIDIRLEIYMTTRTTHFKHILIPLNKSELQMEDGAKIQQSKWFEKTRGRLIQHEIINYF